MPAGAAAGPLPLVYLCRHGETAWNAEGRLQGQSDIPLNRLGRDQARRNGRYLRNVLGASAAAFGFLASPMARAMETMRIIRGELGLAPDAFATDARLMELNFGAWQGSTLADIAERDAPALKRRAADKWHFLPPGPDAESYEALAERARPVFADLARPTIVVAHGGISRIFLRLFAGLGADEAAQAPIPQDRILKAGHGGAEWV